MRNIFKKNTSFIWLTLIICGLTACTNYEYHATKTVTLYKASEAELNAQQESSLLDVSIAVFSDGLVGSAKSEESVYTGVRKSEGVWYASQLKSTFEESQAWGVVRVSPTQNEISDISIMGKLLQSNGEELKLHIIVVDATGEKWIDKEYFQRASTYAYHPQFADEDDVFHSIFAEIVNDTYRILREKNAAQIQNIKRVAALRFANSILPESYASYIAKNENGLYSLRRMPANNDPMFLRVEQIQARNRLYLDVVQDYYRVFTQNMQKPYNAWRKESYNEVRYERQLKAQARNEKMAGYAAILGGVLAQTSGDSTMRTLGRTTIFAGAGLLASGYSKADEAVLHTETLRELGESLEAELEPSVVKLQDRTVTLSGTVDEQMQQWKQILTQMFTLEEGELSDNSSSNEKQAYSSTPLIQDN